MVVPFFLNTYLHDINVQCSKYALSQTLPKMMLVLNYIIPDKMDFTHPHKLLGTSRLPSLQLPTRNSNKSERLTHPIQQTALSTFLCQTNNCIPALTSV